MLLLTKAEGVTLVTEVELSGSIEACESVDCTTDDV